MCAVCECMHQFSMLCGGSAALLQANGKAVGNSACLCAPSVDRAAAKKLSLHGTFLCNTAMLFGQVQCTSLQTDSMNSSSGGCREGPKLA